MIVHTIPKPGPQGTVYQPQLSADQVEARVTAIAKTLAEVNAEAVVLADQVRKARSLSIQAITKHRDVLLEVETAALSINNNERRKSNG